MKTILLIFLCGLFVSSEAQVINKGATIVIKGGTVASSESIYNQEAGVINNEGVLRTEQDLVNLNDAHLHSNANGSGLYIVHRNFENSGTLSNLQFQLEGKLDSKIQSGEQAIQSLHIAKSNGAAVHLISDPLLITEALEFGSNSNRLILYEQDLALAETADVFGYNQNNYFVTTSSGQVIKLALEGYFLFPVGDENAYYPAGLFLDLQEDVGVRVADREQTEETDLKALPHSWLIETESDAVKEVKLYWTAADAMEYFNAEDAAVFAFRDNEWLALSETETAKSEHQHAATGIITESGSYTVGVKSDESILDHNSVALKESTSNQLASILVYPNPSIDFIRIDFSNLESAENAIRIRLLDLLGKEVLSKEVYLLNETVYQLDFPKGKIPPGMYTLQVRTKDKLIATERVIIQTTD